MSAPRSRAGRLARLTARIAGLGILVLLLGPAARATTQQGNDADAVALRRSQAVIGRVTGDHAFVDALGQPLRLSELRGRPVALSLVYTNCYDICSGLTLYLRDAVRTARAALGGQEFSILTVGFDPVHDTPERMRAYGRDRDIDDPNWHLVATDAATIRRLSDDLGFTWIPSSRGFDHIAQVTLLDADGRVVQQIYGQDFAPPALVEPLKALMLGRSPEQLSVRDLIDRVRLYCSVYDPGTRSYRFDYSMFAGVIPVLVVLGMMAVAIAVAGRGKR